MAKSTYTKGRELERKVANLYESLQFEVEDNVNVSGHQIDLVVTKYFNGIGRLRCIVEVKSRRTNVGVNDITSFINASTQLIHSGYAQGAVCVTDANFTQDARSAASNLTSLRLLTFRELEKDLYNYTQSLVEWCRQYRGAKIFAEYISLEGRTFEGAPIDDLVVYSQSWLKNKHNLLIISGDFGSGKTTIAERVLYNCAQEYLANNDAPFPILLPLRTLKEYDDLFSFIEASLKRLYGVNTKQTHFEMQLQSGGFVLILDGFDEIDTGATAIDRANHMNKLSYVLGRGSPCILTTRPTYFESFSDFANVLRLHWPRTDERHFLFNKSEIARRLGISLSYDFPLSELANALTISVLSKDQIKAYVRKRAPEIKAAKRPYTEETILKFIHNTYDLEDLAQRPLLLDMVLTTIIYGDLDISQKDLQFGPAALYEFYTTLCARRDVEGKPGIVPFLCVNDRLEACRRLAVLMASKSTIVLSNEQIISMLRGMKFRTPVPPEMLSSDFIQRASTDIRVCSFLTMDSTDSLKFFHTSFMEFFLAQEIVQRCRTTLEYIRNEIKVSSITIATIYFLASFARLDKRFSRQIGLSLDAMSDLVSKVDPKDAPFNQLILRIAWASGSLLTGKRLKNCIIANCRLRKAELSGTYLERVTLRELSIREAVLNRCTINRGTLHQVDIAEVDFNQCTVELIARDLTIVDSKISKGGFSIGNASKADAIELRKMQSRDWMMSNCLFKGVRAHVSGKGLIFECEFEDRCVVSFDAGTYLDGGSSLRVTGCTARGTKMGRMGSDLQGLQAAWLDEKATASFTSCTLLGLWMTVGDIVKICDDGDRRISLDDCRGVVLTEERLSSLIDGRKQSGSAIDGQRLGKLARIYPNIVFLDLARLAKLRQIKKDLNLRDGECTLAALCSRLNQLREPIVDDETRWSLERLQTLVESGGIELDKLPDVLEHLNALAYRK